MADNYEDVLSVKDADAMLGDICNNKVLELYSGTVPIDVQKRVNLELEAIAKTGKALLFLGLRELLQRCNITSSDISLRGLCSASVVLYLCGVNNFNPLKVALTPYLVFGINLDQNINIDINVPESEYDRLIKVYQEMDNLKCFSDKLHIFSQREVQFSYNLLHRLNIKDEHINYEDAEVLKLFSINDEGRGNGLLGLQDFRFFSLFKMLGTARIESIDDIARVTALSHGTMAWLGNAEYLLKEQVASIREVVSSREDLFDYLVYKGISETDAYDIVEDVRYGRGISEKKCKLMMTYNVPEWYISSCNKVKFLFAKAHSFSIVFNAWRLAYCKVYYPVEFYDEYFKVYGGKELNEAISNGYAAFDAYAKDIIVAYKAGEDVPDEYYNVLVAKEMFEKFGCVV